MKYYRLQKHYKVSEIVNFVALRNSKHIIIFLIIDLVAFWLIQNESILWDLKHCSNLEIPAAQFPRKTGINTFHFLPSLFWSFCPVLSCLYFAPNFLHGYFASTLLCHLFTLTIVGQPSYSHTKGVRPAIPWPGSPTPHTHVITHVSPLQQGGRRTGRQEDRRTGRQKDRRTEDRRTWKQEDRRTGQNMHRKTEIQEDMRTVKQDNRMTVRNGDRKTGRHEEEK